MEWAGSGGGPTNCIACGLPYKVQMGWESPAASPAQVAVDSASQLSCVWLAPRRLRLMQRGAQRRHKPRRAEAALGGVEGAHALCRRHFRAEGKQGNTLSTLRGPGKPPADASLPANLSHTQTGGRPRPPSTLHWMEASSGGAHAARGDDGAPRQGTHRRQARVDGPNACVEVRGWCCGSVGLAGRERSCAGSWSRYAGNWQQDDGGGAPRSWHTSAIGLYCSDGACPTGAAATCQLHALQQGPSQPGAAGERAGAAIPPGRGASERPRQRPGTLLCIQSVPQTHSPGLPPAA